MKILIITHHYLNGVGGGSFASKAFINAFSTIFKDVTLLYPVKNVNDKIEINENIKKIPVTYNIPKYKKIINLCIGKTHRYYNIFNKTIKQTKYDYVIFDNSCVSFHLIDLAHKYNAKVITIHHNYEYEYIRDSSNWVLKPIRLFWVKKYEKQSLDKSDLNLTLTKQDKSLFMKKYNINEEKIEIIGCFEFEERKYDYRHNNNSNSFVITGNLSAQQTKKSILPWLKKYYPLLIKISPKSQLTIAGKNPSNAIKRKCKQLKIRLIDTPPNMDIILENANFYICPTCLGGGIKLRIMDGLRHGLPILTHKISARGYDVFKNKFVYDYNNITEFAISLKTMISKKYDHNQIITEYANEFSFKAGVNRLSNILKKHSFID